MKWDSGSLERSAAYFIWTYWRKLTSRARATIAVDFRTARLTCKQELSCCVPSKIEVSLRMHIILGYFVWMHFRVDHILNGGLTAMFRNFRVVVQGRIIRSWCRTPEWDLKHCH